jgi:hydroxymethylpyrimidine/phosphomethylpyrimidine kinase
MALSRMGSAFFLAEEEKLKKALSIAGSDCSGGAGIQADIKTFSAHGVFGMTVVTSVVAENTVRVIEYQDIRPDIIEKQIDAVFEDIPPDAVKIGMLSRRETMLAVADKLREWKPPNVVIDPVMYAKNGCALMEPSAISTLIAELVPLADILTPNIPEAEKMAEMTIKTAEDMRQAARRIHSMGCRHVVIKGGHIKGDATDILFDGNNFYEFPAARIDTKHTHGTGCTFSSAIAANLARGLSVYKALECAKKYINTAITHAPLLGKGNGPTHHFYDMYKNYFQEEENV